MMIHKNIYSATGMFTLTYNNNPKTIGFKKFGKHYIASGCINPLVVVLHYGTKHQDLFFFENNILVYNSVYDGRESYLQNKYMEIAKQKEISSEKFIAQITECYTMTELGF